MAKVLARLKPALPAEREPMEEQTDNLYKEIKSV
jgi:hypothetical protein